MQRDTFDADYVSRLASGDLETQRHFTTYFGELLSIKLRSRLRSSHVIDDVKQETFLRVLSTLRQKGSLHNPEALGAFVNSVCNNVLFEVYRAEKRTAEEPPDDRPTEDIDAETAMVGEQERALVRDVLQELPEKDRTLLRWVFFEERDKAEVCRALNVERDYLRVLLHRAKLRFRSIYLRTHGQSELPVTKRTTGSARRVNAVPPHRSE